MGGHDFGLADVRMRAARPLSRRVHRDEDAFRAAGREDAGRVFAAPEERLHDGEDLALHPADTRKGVHAEAVFDHVHAERLAQDVLKLIVGVPDISAVAAVSPIEVAGAKITRSVSMSSQARPCGGSSMVMFGLQGMDVKPVIPASGTMRRCRPSMPELVQWKHKLN